MPKYSVTFMMQDSEAEANPFGHAFIALNIYDESTKKKKVEEAWGFYGLPTTEKTAWKVKLKKSIGLPVDFTHNHGILEREELRFLDLGCGLNGVDFELTKEKYDALKAKCRQMIEDQEQVIEEVVRARNLQPLPEGQYKRYKYEHHSPQIYADELKKAAEEKREPRLKQFQPDLTFGLLGPALQMGNHCKSQALKLLEDILTRDDLDRLKEEGQSLSIPRKSGPMEKCIWHSTGPLRAHTKKSGKRVFYRDLKDKDVELYWTFPPQEIVTKAKSTRDLYLRNPGLSGRAKTLCRQLQKLEWLFRNAVFPEKFSALQQKLIANIVEHYMRFSIIEPKKSAQEPGVVTGLAMAFFRIPHDEQDRVLLRNITLAEQLIGGLQKASQDTRKLEDIGDDFMLLAAHLSDEDKKAFHDITLVTYTQMYREAKSRLSMVV